MFRFCIHLIFNYFQSSLSLPGSPFNLRRSSPRGSKGSSHGHLSWWSSCGNRRSFGHPLVLSNYLEAQANLPYVDDSAADSPLSEDNVVGLAAHFLDAPAGGLASLTGLTSLNSLAAVNPYPTRISGKWPGMYTNDREDVTSLISDMRSRKNSYCSHGSRWSYSSHMEQTFTNMRSASQLESSSGTRSCRNLLLAATLTGPTAQLKMMHKEHCLQCDQQSLPGGECTASMSDDASLWPPDYLVSKNKFWYNVQGV